MLVKIEKSQISAMEFAATLCDLKVEFFTIESTVTEKPDTVQVYVLDEKGEEPSPLQGWHLGRQFSLKVELNELIERETKHKPIYGHGKESKDNTNSIRKRME